jgi:hypothetical protein
MGTAKEMKKDLTPDRRPITQIQAQRLAALSGLKAPTVLVCSQSLVHSTHRVVTVGLKRTGNTIQSITMSGPLCP